MTTVQIDDQVTFDGENYYKVLQIELEEIKTMRKGTIIFKRLILENHPPMYEHNVKGKKD